MSRDLDFKLPEKVITYIPLLYNSDVDFSKITNVLLVDTDVHRHNTFVENCNEVTFPITFSQGSDKKEIINLFASKLSSISRIAIVANNLSLSGRKRLLNHKPYFLDSDLQENQSSYSENVQFLIDLIKLHDVKNIDYLACNSLTYNSWQAYYSVLSKETGVIVGASSDKTGNIKYGGDWVMESTGVDIEAVYFMSGISSYQETLDPTLIDFSCKLYQNGWSTDNGVTKNPITWPCILSGNITVTIAENLIYTLGNNFFTISDNINNIVTLDGMRYTISINGVENYPGLVLSRSNSTTVKNIGILTNNNTTLVSSGGWVGQGDGENFNSFIGNINNCYSEGNITNDFSGGIAGDGSGVGGICIITNCYSSGIINKYCGGIVGSAAGIGIGSNCNIINCYSTGIISGNFSGGIVGYGAGYSNGSCTISSCYSTGTINGENCGGIVGSDASGAGVCVINNCYSKGLISGDNSGGIVGKSAGIGLNAICTITNCYTTGGSNGTNCGGIIGNNASNNCTVTNCYTTGIFSGTGTDDITPIVSSANVINSFHTDDWVNNNPLDNTSGCWKVFVGKDVAWNLVSFLTSVTVTVDSTDIIYTNELFPINVYSSASPLCTDGTNTVNGILSNNGKTVKFNKSTLSTSEIITIRVIVSGIVCNIDTFLLNKTGTIPRNTILSRNNIYNYMYSYPLKITGTGITSDKVTLDSNIIVGNFTFSVESGNTVTIGDSSNLCIVTINNANGYRGLVQSLTNSTTVQNIGLSISGSTTLSDNGGWIGQGDPNNMYKFYGTVQNCYSTGAISGTYSGGIAGNYAGSGSGFSCTITNCYSTGIITGDYSGGITGSNAGSTAGTCTINNCYSTGTISGSYSGGITGSNAGSTAGTCDIKNCYNTGTISGSYSGGISGSSAGSTAGTCDINNCYSTGTISGSYSGGITGSSAGSTNGTCNIKNCFSTGIISGNFNGGISGSSAGSNGTCNINNCYSDRDIGGEGSGGITGSSAGDSVGICAITNCYTKGVIRGSCGGIAGINSEATCNISRCYVSGVLLNGSFRYSPSQAVSINSCNYSSVWFDAEASNADNTIGLINPVSNSEWKIIYIDKPWKLLSFLFTARINYNSDTLIYTNVLPISAYPNALTAKLLNNGTTYGSSTLTLTQNTVTFTDITGIDNGQSTYLVLYNGNNPVDYANNFETIVETTTTTTLPQTTTTTSTEAPNTTTTTSTEAPNTTTTTSTEAPTTTTTTSTEAPTTTTTLPPTSFSLVQFAIEATFDVVIKDEASKLVYITTLIDQINSLTGSYDTTVLGVTSGSIVNVVRLPTQYVDALRYAIQSENFYITIDDVTYFAIRTSFIILDNICFRRGTMILTPGGYRAVESLKTGELVRTAQGRNVPITKVHYFIGKKEKCPLYVLYKESLGPNVPIMDLYMSEGHAYSYNGRWTHMKCSSITMELDTDDIDYYNIAVDNYLQHTLIANGLEVESLFDIKELKMTWNCKKDDCKPVITMK